MTLGRTGENLGLGGIAALIATATAPLTPAWAAPGGIAPGTDLATQRITVVALVLIGAAVLLWRWRKRPDAAQAVPDAVAPRAAAGRSEAIEIALRAVRIAASAKSVALGYSLTLTNRSGQPFSALAIEADLTAAQPALAPERQAAAPAQQLVLRHALVGLAPGESTTLTGDVHLPIGKIAEIVGENATAFVPLARVRVEALEANRTARTFARTYIVGEAPAEHGAALLAVRLDQGQQVCERVGQHALN